MQLHIVEGNRQMLDGGAMFGNAPRALWEKWIKPDSLGRIPMACRCLLLTADDGRRILFEAGIGNFFDPQMKDRYGVTESNNGLLENLRALGVDHTDIDVVVLSHLHFDHVGGLLTAFEEGREPELLFPNARFLVGEKQWQRAIHPHQRDRASFLPEANRLLEASGRLLLVNESNRQLVLPGITFHFSDGHTPGLMLSEIPTEKGPLVFCSDLIPGRQWVHLPICMGYDRYPELLIEEKEQLLSRLLREKGRLFFNHDHELAVGWVRKDERNRYFVDVDG